MNYDIYDKLQISLGSVGNIYRSECQKVINASNADESVKTLVSELSDHTEKALNELARLINESINAVSK